MKIIALVNKNNYLYDVSSVENINDTIDYMILNNKDIKKELEIINYFNKEGVYHINKYDDGSLMITFFTLFDNLSFKIFGKVYHIEYNEW